MSAPLIDAELVKHYGVREVLRRARIAVMPGTVHALVGENGAGKSTLVKIIAGVVGADGGSLLLGGKPVELRAWTRVAARKAGIGIVQQHGAFAGTLSVVENAMLGVEPLRGSLLDLAPSATALQALGKKIGLPVDPWARTSTLSLGSAQRAEIVAALHHGARLLVLDEPTAVLTPIEVDGLLDTLRKLAAAGTTIVIVTHKLDEVRAVADEVTVLRTGATVAAFPKPFEVGAIARAMVGAELPEPTSAPAPEFNARDVLSLERVGVRRSLRPTGRTARTDDPGALRRTGPIGRIDDPGSPRAAGRTARSDDTGDLVDVSLTVRAGEIVGVAGVDGNGQRELALAIAGLVPHGGRVRIGQRDVTGASPRARLGAGLAHVPEDRHHGGLVLDASIADNLVLARPDITGRFRIDRARVGEFADAQIRALDIRPADRDAIVRALSGGNQQKVVIARELSRPSLTAIVAAQPTRGVDLGAVMRIHDQLRGAASKGAGVLVISADLDELLALCHRVVVLLRGRIVGERDGAALRAADARAHLGAMMTGAEAA